MASIRFFVPGIPSPGGSKKAFVSKKTGKASVVEDAKGNKDWRARVALAASEIYSGPLLQGPLSIQFYFYFLRPRGHFGKGKNASRLLPSAPKHHTVKPDTTKLLRAAEDALTGVLWRDDTQIVRQFACKAYDDKTGVEIVVKSVD